MILFRHWSLVATESGEKAHEPEKISRVRSFGKVGRLETGRFAQSPFRPRSFRPNSKSFRPNPKSFCPNLKSFRPNFKVV